MRARKINMYAATGAALVGVIILLFQPAPDFWWTYDDFFHLRVVEVRGAVEYLLTPSLWRELPFRMFTPLLFLSLEADKHFFGVRPEAFYLHQLLALCTGAILTLVALRLWWGALQSLAGTLLIFLSVPFVQISQQLMLRHYVEGFVLGAAALILWVGAVRQESWLSSIGSSCFYLGAMLAKEIYIPLALLFVLIPEREWRLRLRFTAPHAAALIVLLVWRTAMIGTLFGGYGWSVAGDEIAMLLTTRLPLMLSTALGFTNGWGGAVLAALLGCGSIVAFYRFPRGRLLMLASAAAAIVPVVPVIKGLEQRHALVLAVTLSIATASNWTSGKNKTAAAAVAVLILLSAFVVNRDEMRNTQTLMRRMSAEGRFFYHSLHGDDLLRQPTIPNAAMAELWEMKQRRMRQQPAGWFYDDYFLCTGGAAGKRVWQQFATGELRDVTREIPLIARKHCDSIRWEQPLEAGLVLADGIFRWRLGPRRRGDYSFILGDGRVRYQVPKEEAFWVGNASELQLRIRYDAPDGNVTYSPVLTVRRGQPVRWRRELHNVR